MRTASAQDPDIIEALDQIPKEEFLQKLNQRLSQKPDSPHFYCKAAEICHKRGFRDEAKSFLSSAARLFIKQKEYSKALALFSKMLNLGYLEKNDKTAKEFLALKNKIGQTTSEPPQPEFTLSLDAKKSGQTDRIAAALKLFASSAVLQSLDDDAYTMLAREAQLERYPDRDRIINAGDVSDKLYLILAGTVHVNRTVSLANERIVCQLGPGDIFAEISFLTRKPAAHAIVANGNVELLTITKDTFNRLSETFPTLAERIQAIHHERLVCSKLLMSSMCADLDAEAIKQIIRMMIPQQLKKNDILIHEGQKRNRDLYVINSGSVRVETCATGSPTHIAILYDGDIFGENVFLDDTSISNCSVIANEDTSILTLDEKAYAAISKTFPVVIKNLKAIQELRNADLVYKTVHNDPSQVMAPAEADSSLEVELPVVNVYEIEETFGNFPAAYDGALPKQHVFTDMPSGRLRVILADRAAYHLDPQKLINQKGAKAAYFYFLVKGKAQVYDYRKDGTLCTIAQLEEGDIFGEGCLLGAGATRSHFVQSITPVTFYRFTTAEFQQFFLSPFPHLADRIRSVHITRLMTSYLLLSPVFSTLSPSEFDSLAKGTTILSKSQIDVLNKDPKTFQDSFFILISGAVHIYLYHDKKPFYLKTLEDGDGILLRLSPQVRLYIEDHSLATLIPESALAALARPHPDLTAALQEITKKELSQNLNIYKSLWKAIAPIM